MKAMEESNENLSNTFSLALEEMSKDIIRLNEEKEKNDAFKAKLLGEMLEKMKHSVIEIEEGNPQPLPQNAIQEAQPLVAKKFAHRDTSAYCERIKRTQEEYQNMWIINEEVLHQDKYFPPTEELSYDNYLTVIHDRSGHYEYNFTFSNGSYSHWESEKPLD
jgi:hypothetical protein